MSVDLKRSPSGCTQPKRNKTAQSRARDTKNKIHQPKRWKISFFTVQKDQLYSESFAAMLALMNLLLSGSAPEVQLDFSPADSLALDWHSQVTPFVISK